MTITRPDDEHLEAPAAPPPLGRNRNYNILWSSQLFSELGFELAMIGIPLLIIAHSGSPLQMGLASSVLAAVKMAAALPAGVVADRWNRRQVMLVCEGLRALCMGSLALALALGHYSFWHVMVVIVLEGVLGSVFEPAEHAAVPQVVPESQLPAALARNAARPFVATLVGPAAAGFLFTVHPLSPFLTTAVMLALSFGALVMLRLPPRRAPAPASASATGDGPDAEAGGSTERSGGIMVGVRWILGNPVIRDTMVWMMAVNLVFNALLVIILVLSGEDDVDPGEMGMMMAFLGAGGLLGALCASKLYEALRPRVLVLGFAVVATAATALMAVVPTGLALGALLGVAGFLAPPANTAVMAYQLTVAPDDLRGRLSSVAAFCSGGAGALGPLAGGLLMTWGGEGRTSVLICAGAFAAVAAVSMLSPSLRRFPSVLEPLDD
ncbi:MULTISPECIES: MFS transporter [Streptomyces]|uniref:MFS transporter n=1 Tax=Streptomyces TaxID=1883 RepID=UPI000A6F73C0|nr:MULTISPECIES: MFS transporter [Streptomyces]WTD04517.1 MFS transporter [Streptomyces albidoflavus]